jgi:hypothetical protein
MILRPVDEAVRSTWMTVQIDEAHKIRAEFLSTFATEFLHGYRLRVYWLVCEMEASI